MTEEQTRWLSDAEQKAWRRYLRASNELNRVLDDDLASYGLSLAEYEILSMLSEAPHQRLRMSALADLVVQSRSRMTHTAKRLETRGWVYRQPCAGDMRGVEVGLTEEGLAELERAAHVHVDGVRKHFIDLLEPEEFIALGDAMGKVQEHVNSDTPAKQRRGVQ